VAAALSTMATARFPADVTAELDRAKILGVRSGSTHRYTGVWVVVVDGRAFVRSWGNRADGWYQAFRQQPRGSIQLPGHEVSVRAVATRSERLRRAVSEAYARKYPTAASRKWVTGFAEPARERNTLELVPD
jgi:hypothetical protein